MGIKNNRDGNGKGSKVRGVGREVGMEEGWEWREAGKERVSGGKRVVEGKEYSPPCEGGVAAPSRK